MHGHFIGEKKKQAAAAAAKDIRYKMECVVNENASKSKREKRKARSNFFFLFKCSNEF